VLSLARPPQSRAGDSDDGAGPVRRHIIALWTDAPAVRALFSDAGVEVVLPPRSASGIAPRDVLRGATGGRDVSLAGPVVARYRCARSAAAHVRVARARHPLRPRAPAWR